jgi:hypothetical protein
MNDELLSTLGQGMNPKEFIILHFLSQRYFSGLIGQTQAFWLNSLNSLGLSLSPSW